MGPLRPLTAALPPAPARNDRPRTKRPSPPERAGTERMHTGGGDYSHSIVAGGFDEMSYTTRFTPRTLFMISFDTSARNS